MTALELEGAALLLGGRPVLRDVSFSVEPGELVGLLGPNGAGKTSAVRALIGVGPLDSGRALIGGRPSDAMTAVQRARAVAYLPQTRFVAWPVAVAEVVALGRFAHAAPFGKLGPADAAAVDEALELCSLTPLAQRSVATLSGGELARVHLARALASGAPALVADEPAASLDPRHAFMVMEVLRRQAAQGRAILVILHDLNLAARFCDRVVLLDEGVTAAEGPPRMALTPTVLASIYGIKARWDADCLNVLGTAV